MAFFDFLNQPVGGYEQSSYLEGVSDYSQGAPQSSMTWGEFIKAISSMGGSASQGSSLMSNPFAQSNQGFINQGFNQSNVPRIQGKRSSFGKNTGEGDSQDISELMQIFSLYSGGFGAGA